MIPEDTYNPYQIAYEREKKARLKAEEVLENKSRELFLNNERLQESYEVLQKQQTAMLKNEKLATLGTLTAGIAHEINNPLAFVKSNIESLSQYHQSYALLIAFIQENIAALPHDKNVQLKELLDTEDIEFIQEDLPELMKDTLEGLVRIRDIVTNLRGFSRTQSSDRSTANLVDGIKSTLKLLHNELKDSVRLEADLQPIPDISCNPSELNQVFLNLIINAKYAIQDQPNPLISITSRIENDNIIINVSDNGCGMSLDVQKEIFTPFYTTKPVGDGTGMGLAIVYNIVKDHAGEIDVHSTEGEGTTFTVRLPIN